MFFIVVISESFQKTVDVFRKLPGMGPRQAARCVFYLLKASPHTFDEFIESLTRVRERLRVCRDCFRLFEATGMPDASACTICVNPKRERRVVMVVENDQDLISIESLRSFNGVYLVLGTRETFLSEEERLARALKKIVQEERREIILATNPTLEGDSLAHRIKVGVSDSRIKITRLGRGLPTGGEIEYADEETIRGALENRR